MRIEYENLKELIGMIRDDLNYNEEGVLVDDEFDSFEILQIIMLLNEKYDIEIPPSEIKPEVFKGLGCIYEMIERVKKTNK